ncbi:surfeit locus protein 2-like [Anneissia japonica]|uniref:surfeit locus protein 2-like n=1 Tax=Anneissia japonica TaxID=1529436 RepID=UPI001425758D|nr:surfeit locus protein 2-like [Anneissia japonica]
MSCVHVSRVVERKGRQTSLLLIMSEINDILKLHPSLEFINDSKKVKCNLSGHEMPAKVEVIAAYTQGKKYKRLRKEGDFDFMAHEKHIVPSFKKGHEHQLFCRLTFRHISKESKDVERHVNGRRYNRALKKYEECQRLGIPFKPNKPKKHNAPEEELRKREGWTASDGSGSSDAESEDSLSDLYPPELFGPFDQKEGNSEDADNEMVTAVPTSNKSRQNGKKPKGLKQTKNSDKSIEEKKPNKRKLKEALGKKITSKCHGKMKKKPKVK